MPPLSQNFDQYMVEGAQRSFLRAAVTEFRTCRVMGLDGSKEDLTATMDGMVLHLEHMRGSIDRMAKGLKFAFMVMEVEGALKQVAAFIEKIQEDRLEVKYASNNRRRVMELARSFFEQLELFSRTLENCYGDSGVPPRTLSPSFLYHAAMGALEREESARRGGRSPRGLHSSSQDASFTLRKPARIRDDPHPGGPRPSDPNEGRERIGRNDCLLAPLKGRGRDSPVTSSNSPPNSDDPSSFVPPLTGSGSSGSGLSGLNALAGTIQTSRRSGGILNEFGNKGPSGSKSAGSPSEGSRKKSRRGGAPL